MRDHIVATRVDDVEYTRLRDLAQASGRSIADLIRGALRQVPSGTVTATPVPPIKHGSLTVPGTSNFIWLTEGQANGYTLTLAC